MRYTVGQRIAAQLYCQQAGINKKYWRNNIKFLLEQEPCSWLPKEIDRAVARAIKDDRRRRAKIKAAIEIEMNNHQS